MRCIPHISDIVDSFLAGKISACHQIPKSGEKPGTMSEFGFCIKWISDIFNNLNLLRRIQIHELFVKPAVAFMVNPLKSSAQWELEFRTIQGHKIDKGKYISIRKIG